MTTVNGKRRLTDDLKLTVVEKRKLPVGELPEFPSPPPTAFLRLSDATTELTYTGESGVNGQEKKAAHIRTFSDDLMKWHPVGVDGKYHVLNDITLVSV